MIREIISSGDVRSVYQPIVRLSTREVVGYEALARGPEGPFASPLTLFAAAAEEGCLAELDSLCRSVALRGAADLGLAAPLTLFVNVEPDVLDHAALEELLQIAEDSPEDLPVVLEITERSLAVRPAELLRTVERVRELGWRVALDDVGAESASLAFMPLLRPDVVKLDLRLVQQRPGPAVAEIMSAVNSYAQLTGAQVLAEGIEDEQHLAMALALGATLGQGWMFGRPAAHAAPDLRPGALLLPPARPRLEAVSPFTCLPDTTELRTSPKSLLIEVSKQLEREAMRVGETCVVAATFQERRHFTPATVSRYRDLADRVGFVCALGDGLPAEPAPGVRGADLPAGDPVREEWDITIIGPHFSAALLARDLGDTGPDRDRTFEYALTFDRDTVVAACQQLMVRVAPQQDRPAPDRSGALPSRVEAVVPAVGPPAVDVTLFQRALASTSNGVAIADMLAPDQPLIYVNTAFAFLSGVPADELLGRNCRFIQGDDTDRDSVARLRSAVAEGREIHETLLNYRGPQRQPWWNEVHLSPVRDRGGRVVQYIGIQNDVTARVEAERGFDRERERASRYLDRIESMAYTDPLTGLMNRRRLEERVEAALLEANMTGRAVALLYLDLDRFKPINDTFGHVVGDRLLTAVGKRLETTLRHSDLVARLGGDEFLVALLDLDPHTAVGEAHRIDITASVGVSVSPTDSDDFGRLLHLADLRMYDRKHPAGGLLTT